MSWTGSDTPIFERYYAGGYSSFRGFAFRGMSPRDGNFNNFKVGGNFMAWGPWSICSRSRPTTRFELWRLPTSEP